jgi:hypothetical protein
VNNSSNASAEPDRDLEVPAGLPKPVPAQLTPAQQAIVDNATEVKWEEQEISWRLSADWKKNSSESTDRTLEYDLPDKSVFLVVEMPAENLQESMQTNYERAIGQQKAGKVENVKMTEVDGIPGLEFTETASQDRSLRRGHHWIGFRSYKSAAQQIMVLVYTDSANYDKHADEFQAILYSIKSAR